jgi:hypothetical protein
MFWSFGNFQAEQKVWAKSYGRCRHITDYKLPSGYRAKRKQKRKAQRVARKMKP